MSTASDTRGLCLSASSNAARSDVLSACGDDDVLLAAGDRQVAVVVELAEISGVAAIHS
jgi:hypothetical protein